MHVISVMGLSIDKYRTASEAAIDFGKFSVSEFNKFDFFSNILFYDFLKILIIVPNKKNLTSRIWISSWNKNSFVERNHVRCFDIRNENECVRILGSFHDSFSYALPVFVVWNDDFVKSEHRTIRFEMKTFVYFYLMN